MNRITNRICRILLINAFLLVVPILRAQTVEKPGITAPDCFAVVIDQSTLENCRHEVAAYKQVLEEEGLPTYVISDRWSSPDQIRAILRDMHRNEGLEGAVLIGDIPVAMILRAQHLTSIYKMDEQEHPWMDVAVPSDRFYDDFGLTFTPVRDSTTGLFHFYKLAPDSRQYIRCDIYTGRIRPQESNGDKYEQVRAYLAKAVRAHREYNPFDEFVSYTGSDSYSNSLTAWRWEPQVMQELFPGTFTKRYNSKYLRFSMEPYMKDNVVRELRRDDLDMMIFHEHGLSHTQYLSSEPETRIMYYFGVESPVEEHIIGLKSSLHDMVLADRRKGAADPLARAREQARKWGLDSTWYETALNPGVFAEDSVRYSKQFIKIHELDRIAPNVRFVYLDACYNGDFREKDYIAGKYIFAPGNTVAVFASTVGIRQDKSTFDLLGMLGMGARLGVWAKNVHVLESHINGDPTFRFTATADAGEDINRTALRNDLDFWMKNLDHPHPDIQNLAMLRLFENDAPGISDILYRKFDDSPHMTVRHYALLLLGRLKDGNFLRAMKKGAGDSFEMIRRASATEMGLSGDQSLIPYLVDMYVQCYNDARVRFNVEQSLLCFDKEKVIPVINEQFAGSPAYRSAGQRKNLLDLVGADPAGKAMKTIKDPDDEWHRAMIRFLRNRNTHYQADELIAYMTAPATPEKTKMLIVESLGWFTNSVEKSKILDAMYRMKSDTQTSAPMNEELTRAINHLNSPK